MSRFGRDLNQRGDDLIPDRFQILFCLAGRKLDATITSQVSISLREKRRPLLKPEIVSSRELIVNNTDGT